jgi:NAD(P)-dependent dehydrogenase (short-subunit alcohol dehydrogenase family)
MARGRASDRVALVTGGTSDLGRPLVMALARLGYGVVINAPDDPEPAAALADEIAGTGRYARALRGDVADRVDVASMFASIEQQEGRLDLLLFRAATWRPPEHDQLTPEDWDEHIGRTLTGAFTCCYHARPLLKEAHGQVVLVASPLNIGLAPGPRSAAWRVGRAGLLELTRSLAVDMAPQVRVNMVSPGWVEDSGPQPPVMVGDVPLLRRGRPEEVVGAVRYLLDACYVTGVNLDVTGGARP